MRNRPFHWISVQNIFCSWLSNEEFRSAMLFSWSHISTLTSLTFLVYISLARPSPRIAFSIPPKKQKKRDIHLLTARTRWWKTTVTFAVCFEDSWFDCSTRISDFEFGWTDFVSISIIGDGRGVESVVFAAKRSTRIRFEPQMDKEVEAVVGKRTRLCVLVGKTTSKPEDRTFAMRFASFGTNPDSWIRNWTRNMTSTRCVRRLDASKLLIHRHFLVCD